MTTFIPQYAQHAASTGRVEEAQQARPRVELFHHRDRGFIPEGLLNYLALLGWSIAADRDVFQPGGVSPRPSTSAT